MSLSTTASSRPLGKAKAQTVETWRELRDRESCGVWGEEVVAGGEKGGVAGEGRETATNPASQTVLSRRNNVLETE